uniref:Uncharacterized protein n=1 Tax=Setaria italica TaxID=4555 RepID=K3YXN3_SETIT
MSPSLPRSRYRARPSSASLLPDLCRQPRDRHHLRLSFKIYSSSSSRPSLSR